MLPVQIEYQSFCSVSFRKKKSYWYLTFLTMYMIHNCWPNFLLFVEKVYEGEGSGFIMTKSSMMAFASARAEMSGQE